jgi:hypothetical protein
MKSRGGPLDPSILTGDSNEEPEIIIPNITIPKIFFGNNFFGTMPGHKVTFEMDGERYNYIVEKVDMDGTIHVVPEDI